MNYQKGKIDNIFLYDTKVDNIFISEYMAAAPEEYVKVYFLGLMYAESGQAVENHLLAKQLNVEEKVVADGLQYWQEKGVLKIMKDSQGEDTVVFTNLREKMFGFGFDEPAEEKAPAAEEGSGQIVRALEEQWGILLKGKDLEDISDWTDFYKVENGLVIKAIEYCKNLNKENLRYLEKVIQGWSSEGITTADEAQKYLDENDQKYYRYRRVLKALGFNRNATEAEKALMDSWFEEMKYNIERVLEACAQTCGISNPNLKYVDAVLKNWKKTAEDKGVDVNKKITVTQAVLQEYYGYLREEAERKAKVKRDEIYKAIPRIRQIDREVSSMYSKMTTAMIGGRTFEQDEYSKQVDKLEQERAILLAENNYDLDYTDIKYSCEKCKDTGLTDEGEKCECMKQRIEEAEVWQREKK